MKFIVGLIIIAFSAFLIAGIFIFLNSKPDQLSEAEKEKAISEMLGRKANTDPDIKTGNVIYKGIHGQFSYPASAKVYEYEKFKAKKSEDEDSFSFDMQNPRMVFNYSATETSESKLDSIPAVKLRQDKSRGYKEENEEIDSVSGLAFSKERSGEYMAEKSVFLLRNGIIYSISITGTSLADVGELYNQVIKTFTFLN